MVVTPNIEYWDNGNKKYEEWRIKVGLHGTEKLHRLDGPAITRYYELGNKKYESWHLNGELHRLDGPAIILYHDLNKNNLSKIHREQWFVDNNQLTGNELVIYKEWLTDNNLYNKLYNTWVDEEKVLWRLRWM